MTRVAEKFANWEIPGIDTLKESVSYKAKVLLLDGKKIDRETKRQLVYDINTNSYFKDSVPLSGWRFSFAAWLKTFIIRTPYGIEIVKAFDRPSAKNFIGEQGFKIVSITEEDTAGNAKQFRILQVVPKDNNTIAVSACPLCGKQHKDAKTPMWLFPRKNHKPLCARCAERYAPEVLKLIGNYAELLKKKKAK